jgi:hypothetical protein
VNDLIGVLIIDSHEVLQQAWKRAIDNGVTDEERKNLSAMPITEAEALVLGETWRDPEIRNRTMAEWTAFARRKYGDYQTPLYVQMIDWVTLVFPVGIAGAAILYLWRMHRS